MTVATKQAYFIVIDGDLRLKVHKGPSGMYVAESLDVAGLATQGKTIEDVIFNAHDAAEALAEARAIMAKDMAKAAKAVKSTTTVQKPRSRERAK